MYSRLNFKFKTLKTNTIPKIQHPTWVLLVDFNELLLQYLSKQFKNLQMAANVITQEDLQSFKIELLEDIKNLFTAKPTEQKLWLRSGEVKELLKISSGTLQNLRMNGTLRTSKIGGILYYNYRDIESLLEEKN